MSEERPLVLDVDGTFLRTDMLYECFWGGLGRDPIQTIKTAATHFNDRSVLKRRMAEIASPRTDLLPVNEDVRQLALKAQAEGREVVLASASDSALVQAGAREHGLSGRVSRPSRAIT